MACYTDGKYCWSSAHVKDYVLFCQNMADRAMQLGIDLTVSNTFTRICEMQWYFDAAKKYGYDLKVVKMTNNYGNIHDVNSEDLEKMKNRWEDFEREVEYS